MWPLLFRLLLTLDGLWLSVPQSQCSNSHKWHSQALTVSSGSTSAFTLEAGHSLYFTKTKDCVLYYAVKWSGCWNIEAHVPGACPPMNHPSLLLTAIPVPSSERQHQLPWWSSSWGCPCLCPRAWLSWADGPRADPLGRPLMPSFTGQLCAHSMDRHVCDSKIHNHLTLFRLEGEARASHDVSQGTSRPKSTAPQ